MPKKLVWSFVDEFSSYIELDRYFATKINTSTTKKNKLLCTLCVINDTNHEMQYRIRKCASKTCNKDNLCEFQYKILNCTKSKEPKFHLYCLNQHNLDEDDNHAEERIYNINSLHYCESEIKFTKTFDKISKSWDTYEKFERELSSLNHKEYVY